MINGRTHLSASTYGTRKLDICERVERSADKSETTSKSNHLGRRYVKIEYKSDLVRLR